MCPAGYYIGMHINFTLPSYATSTYPMSWIQIYADSQYSFMDPTAFWARSSDPGIWRWSELHVPDPQGIMRQAAEHGLIYGAIATTGNRKRPSILGFARSDREYTDEEIQRLYALSLDLHNESQPVDKLTPPLVTALHLAAQGFRSAEAAFALGISESGYKQRLQRAKAQIMAKTTAEAIQKAKDMKLF